MNPLAMYLMHAPCSKDPHYAKQTRAQDESLMSLYVQRALEEEIQIHDAAEAVMMPYITF